MLPVRACIGAARSTIGHERIDLIPSAGARAPCPLATSRPTFDLNRLLEGEGDRYGKAAKRHANAAAIATSNPSLLVIIVITHPHIRSLALVLRRFFSVIVLLDLLLILLEFLPNLLQQLPNSSYKTFVLPHSRI